MEALLKKYFWIVKVLGIAASAGLAASAIMTQLGSSVLLAAESDAQTAKAEGEEGDDDEVVDEEGDKRKTGVSFKGNPFDPPPADNDKKGPEKQKVGTRVTGRNMFCPMCLPPTPEVGEEGVTPDGQPVVTNAAISPGEVKSSLPLQLVATMEFSDPDLSYATVYDAEAGRAGLYARGDAVRDEVVVMSVTQGVLHLRNRSQLEYLELGQAPAKPTAAPTTTAKPEDKAPVPNDREIEGAEEAINCEGESCTVDRAFVESLMANPAQLTKQARIVPSQKDGETRGYKLYGIRRGTLPKLLGFKNGDMLKSVNGEDLTSIDKAMGLYTKLRRASNLTVEIERKGKTVTKEITIK
mgnify:CR=1 FL=1